LFSGDTHCVAGLKKDAWSASPSALVSTVAVCWAPKEATAVPPPATGVRTGPPVAGALEPLPVVARATAAPVSASTTSRPRATTAIC
jgi:hypothetical protein